MNATDVKRLEAIIDTSGIARRLELLLPIGVRPRQLRVRTLVLGMLLVAAEGRPAHLVRVHQALLALAADDRHRLGITTEWKTGPHLLTYRQVERTFALVSKALSDDTPDGAPSETLSNILDALLEASVQMLGEPATGSYAVDWTNLQTWSRPPPKRDAERAKPLAHNDPDQPTPDSDSEDDQSCADTEASWGHRRGNHPGHKDELFYGYYLQAVTTVKDEYGPPIPELARRMLLTSCHLDPPAALVPVLQRMSASEITITDVLADSGYAYRIPETWALPIRALGASLVQDLHPNDRGPQGTHHGAICSNGRAQGKIRCPHRPASLSLPHDRPTILKAPEHPPACCTQSSQYPRQDSNLRPTA